MAQVFREDGFVGEIWPDDHRPPHVHVFKGEFETVIAIGDADGPYVLKVKNMKAKDIKKALTLLEKNRQAALDKWVEFHD